ncbi:hypothetical protein VTO73DRAFT_3962 [Trametes versicolor]
MTARCIPRALPLLLLLPHFLDLYSHVYTLHLFAHLPCIYHLEAHCLCCIPVIRPSASPPCPLPSLGRGVPARPALFAVRPCLGHARPPAPLHSYDTLRDTPPYLFAFRRFVDY